MPFGFQLSADLPNWAISLSFLLCACCLDWTNFYISKPRFSQVSQASDRSATSTAALVLVLAAGGATCTSWLAQSLLRTTEAGSSTTELRSGNG